MSHYTSHTSVDIQRMLSGEFPEYVVTHPGRSQYSQTGGGVSACGLAALNCARIVLGLRSTGLGTAQLIEELTKRDLLEVRFLDALGNCTTYLITHEIIVGHLAALSLVVKL